MGKELLSVVFFLLTVNCCFAIYGKSDFNAWKTTFGKTYATQHEEDYRYSVWVKNHKKVDTFNSEDHSYTLAMNQFSDQTSEEWRSCITTYNISLTLIALRGFPPTYVTPTTIIPSSPEKNLPPSVDWRAEGAVTPIENQGICGASPFFSAAVSMEGVHVISNQGPLVSLSVQQIMNCSKAYGNLGCSGGYMDASIQYVVNNGGIESTEEAPYYSSEGISEGECEYDPSKSVASFDGLVMLNPPTEEALMEAIAIAPVAAVMALGENFFMYSSGVYNDPTCESQPLVHGIAIVGYGATSNGTEYYILKNSFGVSWGMEGFAWLARNAGNMCTIANEFDCYAVINSTKSYR